TTVTMDELLTTPVDQESRLSIVDVEMPSREQTPVVLSKLVDNKVQDFINVVKHQSDLIKSGIEVSNTLLLYGKPGCGKTTVAKYISEKTGLPLVIARFNAVIEIGQPQDKEIFDLIKTFTADFKTDFTSDEKKLDKVIKLMDGKTPSDIKSIVNNSKAHAIINGNDILSYENLLVEVFEF